MKFQATEKLERHLKSCKVCGMCRIAHKHPHSWNHMHEFEKHMMSEHPEEANPPLEMDDMVPSDYGAVCFLCGCRSLLGS